MKRLLLIFLGMAISAAAFAAESPAPIPNILIILADDLGYSDLGCYGGEIATPNLDSIAKNGLRFTQFYNTARCWPTRGALMTGYYAQQIRRDTLPGIPSGGGNRGIRPDWAVLLPKMLAPQGYRSYHTGKWHIDGMPIENGFDHSYYIQDQGRFFNPTKLWKDDVALPPVGKNSGYYATRALADHVVEVLEEHAEKYADAPFLQYLAFAAPHFPLHALPEDIAIYQDTYREGWESIRAKRWARMQELGLLKGELSAVERDLGPPYDFPEAMKILGDGEVNRPLPWDSLTDVQKEMQSDKMAIHAAMIHRMDIEIGRVFAQIKKMGQWDNTLVMFLSDNGASAEIMVRDDGHDPAAPRGSAASYLCLGPGWSTSSNTPFRRHKTWTHEGGISTPLVVSWPKGIEARGEFRNQPGHVIDIVPTLLELAGASAPENVPPAPGKSLVPAFAKSDAAVDHDSLWWFHDGHKAVRVGDWKAVASKDEPWELYDLSTDRDESENLAAREPERLKELVAVWDRQLADTIELASRDLPKGEPAKKPNPKAKGKGKAKEKGAAESKTTPAPAPKTKVLINGETFPLGGKEAFLMLPEAGKGAPGMPWIFYGPTLPPYPDQHERDMHAQFLDAGIAIAGIDVGEAFGSPLAFPHFESLYQEMVERGFSKKPILLGRSRGGLWVSSWAIAHPERVTAIAGIYPVFDYTTYPGVQRAAPAYGLSPEELLQRQDELNPIRRAGELAAAKIPVYIIHGIDDTVVPLAENSAALEATYEKAGAGDLIEVLKIEGQGHNHWPGFFHCEELIRFVIHQVDGGKGE
ncbi:MAG: sulfatase-like hydrolase/transferase [Verrucomicrobiae bacterium]|nr:sulfatase-like hydrolase/transferase [Verrucomicrobiae bacterium]